ncbi:hypothetical protein K2Y11_08930 [bacterium]|nr:hypothetical protein [bacterium]
MAITITADASFKDTVNLNGNTLYGSTFLINPSSVYFCPNDAKTASVKIETMPENVAEDTLTITASAAASAAFHDLEISLTKT